MDLKEYQEKAMSTCMASSYNFAYMMLNQVGETGEFASKIAKGIRKGKLSIEGNNLKYNCPVQEADEIDKSLKLELGDELWQLVCKCRVLGFSINEVARMNLEKLQARKADNTINGDGDVERICEK